MLFFYFGCPRMGTNESREENIMEYTVEITTFCPNFCDYCSTRAGDIDHHLDVRSVEEFLKNVAPGDRINISGGEPLAHPGFYEILQFCKSKTDDVWVYTNAIEKMRYNTSVLKEVTIEANVCLVPGREAYIPQNADKVRLLQLVPTGRAENMQPANIHVSGNIRDGCKGCNHLVLQADGQVVDAPCKKNYKGGDEN